MVILHTQRIIQELVQFDYLIKESFLFYHLCLFNLLSAPVAFVAADEDGSKLIEENEFEVGTPPNLFQTDGYSIYKLPRLIVVSKHRLLVISLRRCFTR